MNRKVIGFGAAVTALGLTVALTSSPALAAVEDGTYGIWSATDVDNAPTGELTFGNSTVGGATYVWTNNTIDPDFPNINSTGYPYIESTTSKGDWIAPGTDMGAIFGADGPSATENLLILDSSDKNTGTLSITFDNPVPANYLGVAIMDIDSANIDDQNESDRVTVEAATGDGTDLLSAELNAAVFNFCDVPVDADMPDNCGGSTATTVPHLTEPSLTSVYFRGDATNSSDTGDSGWLNPTKEVKNLNITWTGNDTGSSVRVAIAVKQDKPELPNTGVDVTTGALSALVLGALGAVAVIATRRRNA